MADEILLNNFADDSEIKKYIVNELFPRVFHDIPLNVLNTGSLSIINEYMSQAIESMAFTSAFYFNESFITKAVLSDSIYSEAAIFNLGYSFATPSVCNFLLELKIDDIYNNAVYNSDSGMYEFILDKNTKFNMSNGSVYSLDYDILIQYKNVETSNRSATVPVWNIQYINDTDLNSIAINGKTYILYRVTDVWLCLFVKASEFVRETHIVTNNTVGRTPNQDTVISVTDHIAGFDIKYKDGKGNEEWIPHDHILPIHANVTDTNPYVHYIMDNPRTIRFMWQLNGNKHFIPRVNSSYEIVLYTCHGDTVNTTAVPNEQPKVITSANTYTNNGNVLKAVFVISPSMGGTNIGTVETVRRETIEAYNTANVLSSDHDIDEWFKTFFFKNIMYPFFFKRRDDPWGRIWSGFIALKDNDDYIFRTNTLHGKIGYDVLYNNNDNIINSSEIIIPPGWIWTYNGENRYTVTPYTKGDGITIETAKTLASISENFVFANPFGIRIQKAPFAIGYFNPWINDFVTVSKINKTDVRKAFDDNMNDLSYIYHATPISVNIKRTFVDNYYNLTVWVIPTVMSWIDGSPLVKNVRQNAIQMKFANVIYQYFKEPLDMYSSDIPMMILRQEDVGYLPFDPDNTYFCAKTIDRYQDEDGKENGTWNLSNVWIEDETDPNNPKSIYFLIENDYKRIYGDDVIWGDQTGTYLKNIYVSGNTDIKLYRPTSIKKEYDDLIVFERIPTQNYYEMRISPDAGINEEDESLNVDQGFIAELRVSEYAVTELRKYGESMLIRLNRSYVTNNQINFVFKDGENPYSYTITNSANVYIPWDEENVITYDEDSRMWKFDLHNLGRNGIILYADMKPSPEDGAVDYYRVPFSVLSKNMPMFHVENEFLNMKTNNMRVVLHALYNGTETGRIEMQPVMREDDTSYRFDVNMYPLQQLVDVNNRITIASTSNGGGSWEAVTQSGTVVVDATEPEFMISIFIKSEDPNRDSDLVNGDSFTGFRLVDQYEIDNISLVQELKEMRSVVNFGESSVPSQRQFDLYNNMMNLNVYNPDNDNLWNLTNYVSNRANEIPDDTDFEQYIRPLSRTLSLTLVNYLEEFKMIVSQYISTNELELIISAINSIYECDNDKTIANYNDDHIIKVYYYNNNIYSDSTYSVPLIPEEGRYYVDIPTNIIYTYDTSSKMFTVADVLVWDQVYNELSNYNTAITSMFSTTNVNGGIEIQLIPFVEYSLMTSERFESFVSSFTQVHKAIEPVIMKRLEGNNYLDCKLTATYGLPHSYCADIDLYRDNIFWPDLNIQIEFDVCLFNQALATNTINELISIVKSYFGRITNVHTATDMISMDNNIYISNLIQLMEEHPNVAYLKFKGFYTDQKNKVDGNYMDSNYQAIVRKWEKLEDFPTDELERYVPEMFVLDDDNIVINIIK